MAESISRSRGFSRAAGPVYTVVDELPHDLGAFLFWFDPNIWSGLVNPEQERKSDRVIYTKSGERITLDHPDDERTDPIYILRPDELKVVTVGDESTSAFQTAVDCLDDLGWDSEVLEAQFYWFGRDRHYCDFLFALDDRFVPKGSIVYTMESDVPLVWIAESMSKWIEKLVYFEGIEYTLFMGDLDELPRRDRKAWVSEFNRLNPQVDFFR